MTPSCEIALRAVKDMVLHGSPPPPSQRCVGCTRLAGFSSDSWQIGFQSPSATSRTSLLGGIGNMFNLPPLRASNVERTLLCPGSRALESACHDERTRDSASGDKAHALAADYFRSFGSDDEAWPAFVGNDTPESDVAERFIMIVADVFERWGGHGEKHVEEGKLWLNENFNTILTGHPDLYFIHEKKALVFDLKSLWGEHTESVRNPQLRAYARLIEEDHGVDEVTVALVQPRASSKPQTCLYTAEDLLRVAIELMQIISRSEEQDAPRVAGEKQCRFCKAKSICPEANATVKTLATLHTRDIEPVDLIRMLDLIGPAKKVIGAIEARAKAMLEADINSLEGWTLEKGSERRTVTDPQAAFTAVSDVLPPDEFAGCCTVKISELETAFRRKTGLKTLDAKHELESRLGKSLEKKSTAPSLARIKTLAA